MNRTQNSQPARAPHGCDDRPAEAVARSATESPAVPAGSQSLDTRTGEPRQPHDAQRVQPDGVAELIKDLSWHRDTQRVQEVLNRLANDAAAVASAQLEGLRARERFLANTIADAQPVVPSKLARIWITLRSLGVTPIALAREPGRFSSLLRLAARPRILREAHLVAHSGIFDGREYARRYPDVVATGMTPLAHFMVRGGGEGRSPHPLFDSAWYSRKHADVALRGANPLADYLRTIGREDRDPHPLFSVRHYRSQIGPTAPANIEPLQHYLRHGTFKGCSPHPLFDPRYYLESYASATGADPLVHFLEAGAAANFNPHPLFDVAYYRSQALATIDGNPLVHYLESGSIQGLRPHPLFDPAYYLAANRDIADSKIEPLTHYVIAGGAEGRKPIRDFDSAWYLDAYRDVAEDGTNPLTHFVRHGWREHRNPSAHFDTVGYLARYPDVAESAGNPLVHYVQHGRAEGRVIGPLARDDRRIESDVRIPLRTASLQASARPARPIICLTHVMPTSPRAGNEYRIRRLLRWLRASGYIVVPVIVPIQDARPTATDIRRLADDFGNAVVCQTDGSIEYDLREIPDVLQSLDGKFASRWATPLGEDLVLTERERGLLQIDRAFCTDALIETVLRLQTVLGPYVLLAEYIWMSRLLPLLDSRALKVIDTIDVFSTRADKVDRYGVHDLAIGRDDERIRLERADVIIAIQNNERAVLESLAPSLPVITSGVDFDIVADPGVPTDPAVLCVASGNPMNRRGLQDFLEFAWPRVRERVPAAELRVVGAVGESIGVPPPGVTILGTVADLGPLYSASRVVINPTVAGTGVKIKTLEALSYLRPVVAWPNGVDGVAPEVAALCRTVDDWSGFAEAVADMLSGDRPAPLGPQDRETLQRAASPERVYAELDRTLNDFFATGC